MLKALIFDFDGVIVDTESEWFLMYQSWLRENSGYTLTLERFLEAVGTDAEEFHRSLTKEHGSFIDWDAFRAWADDENTVRTLGLPACPGVEKLLRAAKEKGIKVSLGTSSRRDVVEIQLVARDLMQYFDALSTSDLSEHVKPAPDIFLKAAELLEVKPEECLVIEDSRNGLIAAGRAGMRCMIVPNEITKHLTFEGYYRKVNSLEDVELGDIANDFL